ncbi:MAG: cyclic nucleotide-binding domain-containing protein [Synechococcus sp. s2_metabat2_7]|nr:cyclic nucleotide-binding domain-containing protein [Synechococcus sp. s2_metabat2_7]
MSYHTMLGVHPRLSQLLVTHLKELKAESLQFASGDVVIEEQEHADDILLLLSGELSVEIGAQRELARIKPGELLGEMGLSGDNRHCATVRVQNGPAEIIRVNADALLRLALFDGDLALEMLALSSARCRQGNQITMLLLDSIQALSEGNILQLERCINHLQTEAGGFQTAAQQLASIRARLDFPDASSSRSE